MCTYVEELKKVKAHVRLYSFLVLLAVMFTACSNPLGSSSIGTNFHAGLDVATLADHLKLISGDGQSASVSGTLAKNPTVLVQDALGSSIPGVLLEFQVTSGSGSVSQALVISDANGNAAAAWTLGSLSGVNTLTVSRSGTALPGSPSQIIFTARGIGVSDVYSSIVPSVMGGGRHC